MTEAPRALDRGRHRCAMRPDPSQAMLRSTRSSSCASRARSSSAPSSPSRSRSSRRRTPSPARCTRRRAADPLPHRRPGLVLGRGRRRRTPLGRAPVTSSCMPYGDRHDIGGDDAGGVASRCSRLLDAAAVERAARHPPRRRRRAHRPRLRLPALRGPAVRSRDAASSRRRSSCAFHRGRRRDGSRRASPTRSKSGPPSNASTSLITTRLPELVLIEVLRLHLATAPAADHGWLAALARPGARARPRAAAPRAGTHAGRSPSSRRPRRCRARCSTSASARCSAGRRSGTSPSGACTSPRSCSPRPKPASSPIAHRVGYESEEAFSRAFKRAHGLSPSHWRAARARRRLRLEKHA